MRRDFSNQIGNELTTVHTARLSRKRTETARLSGTRRRRRDISDQDGDGATFQTKTETAQIFRPRWRRCDQDYVPRDWVGYGATFQTKAERALLSRPSQRRRDQEIIPRDQGGGGATFQIKAETARLFRIEWRRHDFPDQGGEGAIFHIEEETEQQRTNSSPQWWMCRKFSNKSVETAQTKANRRDIPDQGGDSAIKNYSFATVVYVTQF